MTEPDLVRRLTTIMDIDVVGFSTMSARDEEHALTLLNARMATAQAVVKHHRGRVFKMTGDGLLAEFVSPVEAVRAALEIQEAMRAANDPAGPNDQLVLRIGINLGDVVESGDDLMGDAVNVAARLESIAKPGGICVSAAVYEQIEGKLTLGAEDMGEQHVKNIPRAIHAYRLTLGGAVPTTVAPPAAGARASRLAIILGERLGRGHPGDRRRLVAARTLGAGAAPRHAWPSLHRPLPPRQRRRRRRRQRHPLALPRRQPPLRLLRRRRRQRLLLPPSPPGPTLPPRSRSCRSGASGGLRTTHRPRMPRPWRSTCAAGLPSPRAWSTCRMPGAGPSRNATPWSRARCPSSASSMAAASTPSATRSCGRSARRRCRQRRIFPRPSLSPPVMFDAATVPLAGERARQNLSEHYAKTTRQRALVLGHGHVDWWSPSESDADAIRRNLQTCGQITGRPCVVYAVRDEVVVRVAQLHRVTAIFTPQDVATTDAAQQAAVENYLIANDWRALAVSGNGYLGVVSGRANETAAANDAVAECAKAGGTQCRLLAVGPFLVDAEVAFSRPARRRSAWRPPRA